jgi:hypothetical protein
MLIEGNSGSGYHQSRAEGCLDDQIANSVEHKAQSNLSWLAGTYVCPEHSGSRREHLMRGLAAPEILDNVDMQSLTLPKLA